jgi:hypothetical protein
MGPGNFRPGHAWHRPARRNAGFRARIRYRTVSVSWLRAVGQASGYRWRSNIVSMPEALVHVPGQGESIGANGMPTMEAYRLAGIETERRNSLQEFLKWLYLGCRLKVVW